MTKIILASSSPYRKQLLERLGISFDCISPSIDEDSFKTQIENPTELAQTLAYEKALKVALKHPESIVIGSDQLVCIDNEILGKAGTFENAIVQLKKLSGKTHQLITAVCLISGDTKHQFCNIANLKMLCLSEKQIKSYLRKDNPIDCAGSYKLELNGISLFEGIETTDHTAITGLPLIELGKGLRKFGIIVPTES